MTTTRRRPRAKGFVLLAVLLALAALTAGVAIRIYPTLVGGERGIGAPRLVPRASERALLRRVHKECVRGVAGVMRGPPWGGAGEVPHTSWHVDASPPGRCRIDVRRRDVLVGDEQDKVERVFVEVTSRIGAGIEPLASRRSEVVVRVTTRDGARTADLEAELPVIP